MSNAFLPIIDHDKPERKEHRDNLKRTLRMMRRHASLLQEELGELVKMPQSTISKYELGIRVPGKEAMVEIERALGCPTGVLWGAYARDAWGLECWYDFPGGIEKRSSTFRKQTLEILNHFDQEDPYAALVGAKRYEDLKSGRTKFSPEEAKLLGAIMSDRAGFRGFPWSSWVWVLTDPKLSH